jgi:hypothetical protein
MHRVAVLLATAVPVLLAAPAPAAAEAFAQQGAVVLGGSVAVDSDTAEAGKSTVDNLEVDLSPELTYFTGDRFGLRLAPSLRYFEETHNAYKQGELQVSGGTSSQTWAGLSAGPVYYLPLTGRTFVGGGVRLGYEYRLLAQDLSAKGLVYGAEVGLAFLVGTGGVVELGGRYTARALTERQEGVDETVDLDLSSFSLGLRFGAVL